MRPAGGPVGNARPVTVDRERTIARFLDACGWGEARRGPLAGDASFRRYERLEGPHGRAVLMDAPPPREDVRPFIDVAGHLASIGLSAPAVLARDTDAGLLLLEDLGDSVYTRVLEDGANERALYIAAVDALVVLQRAPVPDGLPPYDDELFLFEVSLLADWFMPLAGLELPGRARCDLLAIWRDLLAHARMAPDCTVLRDYHADNLLWLPDRDGVARVGQLDFQDAVVGPPAYDLVSLLEDARRDVAPGTVRAAVDRYLDGSPRLDRDDFRTACAVLGAQRNLKIVGIFCRLLSRDGKPRYQDYLPRVWGHVASDLRHRSLAPLEAWLDRWIPAAARGRAA